MKLKLILLLIIAHSAAFSRAIDVKISGKEILCEMACSGSAISAPGIYSLSLDTQKFKCIIPNGRSPIWSPDRKKIAYWFSGAIWILDIQKGLSYPSIEGYDIVPPPVDSWFQWYYDGSGLVYRQSTQPYPSVVPILSKVIGNGNSPLWKREKFEQVGKVTFAADGKKAAYESASFLSGIGYIPDKIGVAVINSTEHYYLEKNNNEVNLNPHWQPGGDHVAYEVVSMQNNRSTIRLYNTESKGSKDLINIIGEKRMNLLPMPYDECSQKLLGWSPDGKSLLIQYYKNNCTINMVGVSFPCIIPLDVNEAVKIISGPMGLVHCARWSIDSKYIVLLKNTFSELDRSSYMHMVIVNAENEQQSMISIPNSMVPIFVDW